MPPEFNRLRLEQLDASLNDVGGLKHHPPPQGWLKVIREALGRTQRQQAARLGITGPTLHKSEQAEADGRITLGQLRKLANELDCDVVYALVPRRSLMGMVRERARAIALEEVESVAHSMSLEGQRPSDGRLRSQIAQRTDALLRSRWSDLWR